MICSVFGFLSCRTGACREDYNLVLIMSSDLIFSVHFRVRVRYQKRQKLQFETKLGMNSPF